MMRSNVAWFGARQPASAFQAARAGVNGRRPRFAGLLLCLALSALVACSSSPPQTTHQQPTVTPTASPTASLPAPAPLTRDLRLQVVNDIIRHMSLDQELGQLFIVEYTYPDPNHPDLQNMIGSMGAGGVILYKSMNIESIAQMQQLTRAMQSTARIPLIIGADEEGGGDDQTDGIFGPHPTELEIGQTGDPAVAGQYGSRLASELRQLGMNADFAPVVDVLNRKVAWIRAFSYSPTTVSQLGAAEVDAMQSDGVMACLKHFPGLGATTVNPHMGLPIINSSRQYIEQMDLAPYRALMSHHPAMIMTTDLIMTALDPTMPAELSYPIVTGVLRNEIGYDGVVVTDALYMGGISEHYSMSEAGVLAIEAGNDMLEGPWNTEQMSLMVGALRDAVHAGKITKARIDESVRRILLLKQRFGMLPIRPTPSRAAAGAQTALVLPAGTPLGDAIVPRTAIAEGRAGM